MKAHFSRLLLAPITLAALMVLAQQAPGQNQAPAKPQGNKTEDTGNAADSGQKRSASNPEEKFKLLFTKAYLSGRWAPLKDGELGEERTGDRYQIVSVTKGTADNWIIKAKLKYHGQEIEMPVPVRMKFDGDTTILMVDDLMIPDGGTFTARLLIYGRTYSGTWKDQRGGGMLYGTISHEPE
jgi:hypothetical protein